MSEGALILPFEERFTLNTSRYLPEGPLGRGAFGVTFKVWDEKLERYFALKVSDPTELALEQLAKDGLTAEKSLRNEVFGEEVSRLVKRNLMEDDDGQEFLVMNYYPGNLSDKLNDSDRENRANVRDGTLSLEELIGFSKDLSLGLKELHTIVDHGSGWIHGDLKLDNILLDENGVAYITDFGRSSVEGKGGRTIAVDRTDPTAMIRAPEHRVSGNGSSMQGDVWSFGSLMYRMFTGNYIYEDIEYSDDVSFGYDMRNKINQTRSIPNDFKTLIKRCLEPSKDERFEDGSELHDALTELLENRSVRQRATNFMKKYLAPIGLGASALGLVCAAIMYKPTDLTMPSTMFSELPGVVQTLVSPKGERFRFVLEQDTIDYMERQKDYLPDYAAIRTGFESDIIRTTGNGVVGYLMNQYFVAREAYNHNTVVFDNTTWGFHGSALEDCKQNNTALKDREEHNVKIHAGRYISQRKVDFYANCKYLEPELGDYQFIYDQLEESITVALNNARYVPKTGGVPKQVYLEETLAMAIAGVNSVEFAKRRDGSDEYYNYSRGKFAVGSIEAWKLPLDTRYIVEEWARAVITNLDRANLGGNQ